MAMTAGRESALIGGGRLTAQTSSRPSPTRSGLRRSEKRPSWRDSEVNVLQVVMRWNIEAAPKLSRRWGAELGPIRLAEVYTVHLI